MSYQTYDFSSGINRYSYSCHIIWLRWCCYRESDCKLLCPPLHVHLITVQSPLRCSSLIFARLGIIVQCVGRPFFILYSIISYMKTTVQIYHELAAKSSELLKLVSLQHFSAWPNFMVGFSFILSHCVNALDFLFLLMFFLCFLNAAVMY